MGTRPHNADVAKRTDTRARERQLEREARDRETLGQVGVRVRSLRNTRGLSQERLAERAGLTSKFLGEVERLETNPSITSVARLAEALAVNVSDLFEPTEEILPVSASQLDALQEAYYALGRAIQGLVLVVDESLAANAVAPPRARRGDRTPRKTRR